MQETGSGRRRPRPLRPAPDLPASSAINSLNRSTGQQDLYPFVLPQPAIDKMAYVHRTIRAAAKRS
ncbi:putative zinc-binding metallopeptidase [Thiocapsa sp.]|uniref:putative zinc-binding metallopeptidase n=1 Tax=Thiocapsa sp. TaxID=2024551 RepID=UPI0039C9F8DE